MPGFNSPAPVGNPGPNAFTSNGNPFGYPEYGTLQKVGTALGVPMITDMYNAQIANAAAKQAAYEEQQRQQQAATFFSQYADVPKDKFGRTYLTPEQLTNALPYQANKDFGSAQGQLNQGQLPTNYGIAPATQVQQQGQQINTRQGVVSDTGATMGYLPNYATGSKPGFYGGQIGQGVTQQMNPPNKDGKYSIPTLDPGTDGQQTLAAGVGQADWGNQSPFTMGVPSIPELTTARNNEQQNANTLFGHQVTNAHYGRSDANDQTKANADMLRAQKYQVFPPSGPAPNLESLYQSGQITKQEYLSAKHPGGGTQIPTLTQQAYLMKLHNDAMPSNGIFGIGAHPANPQAIAQYNSYAQKYGVQPITLPPQPTSLPFGGQAPANLKNSGFAKWKAGKK